MEGNDVGQRASEPESLADPLESPAERSFLESRHLCKSFATGTRQNARLSVLSDISFSMTEGTFLSVIGPSGCGKSTLLRLIAGLERPDSGEVLVRNEVVCGPRLDRGVVFQAPNLMPWRTASRNVELGLESLGIRRAERRRRATELLELVGIGNFGHFYPWQLSGGMQQRVGLARALAIDPVLLLMDEPFAAVDAQTRQVLQEELQRIWLASLKSVVFITHDIAEAIFLSDEVLVMGKSPGTIVDKVAVGFERPRDYSIRGTTEFAELETRVLHVLRHADGGRRV